MKKNRQIWGNKTRFVLLAVLFFVVGQTATAEKFDRLRENALRLYWRRIGIFYLTPKFMLNQFGRSSNIYNYDRNVQPDWLLNFGASLQVAIAPGHRWLFILRDVPAYAFYFSQRSERFVNNVLSLAAYTRIAGVSLGYKYENSSLRWTPTYEFGTQVRQRAKSHRVTAEVGEPRFFGISWQGQITEIRFHDERYLDTVDLSLTYDRDERTIGIGLFRRIFTATRLTLGFDLYEQKFIHSPIRDRWGWQAMLAVALPEIGNIKGEAKLGLKSYTPEGVSSGTFYRPAGSGSLVISLLHRLKLRSEYFLNNNMSVWSAEQCYNESTVGSGFDYYLTHFLRLGIYYRSTLLKYTDLSGKVDLFHDHLQNGSVTVVVRLFQNTGVGLTASQVYGRSDISGRNRNSFFIGGYITNAF